MDFVLNLSSSESFNQLTDRFNILHSHQLYTTETLNVPLNQVPLFSAGYKTLVATAESTWNSCSPKGSRAHRVVQRYPCSFHVVCEKGLKNVPELLKKSPT